MSQWWWLSFSDAAPPDGLGFLGACLVGPADDRDGAFDACRQFGCVPSAASELTEVFCVRMTGVVNGLAPEEYRRRLLTHEEVGHLSCILEGADEPRLVNEFGERVS